MTIDHVYLSMYNGERVKINAANQSIDWIVDYGDKGFSIALSSDETFLIVGSWFLSNVFLGKLSIIDGAVTTSYSYPQDTYYLYILVSDQRALCFANQGWFQLINTTDFSLLLSGSISGESIKNGDFVNSTHVVIATLRAHLILMTNTGAISW